MQQHQVLEASGSTPPPSGLSRPILIDSCRLCDERALFDLSPARVPGLDEQLLLREAHHRIKNDLQIVASLLSIQARASHEQSLRLALTEAADRIYAVARLHQRLQSAGGGAVEGSELLTDICDDLMAGGVRGLGVVMTVSSDPVVLEGDQAAALSLIVNELVVNALKHAFGADGGNLTVSLRRTGLLVELAVCDDGPGLQEIAEPSSGLGLGLVAQLAVKLGGQLFSEQAPGGGACMRVVFPIMALDFAPRA